MTISVAPSVEERNTPLQGERNAAPDDTAAVQRRIDQAAALGGGEVRLAAGRYTVAGLQLRSHVTLYLEKDAVLLGCSDPTAYGENGWYSAIILAKDVKDASIAGEGVIDGQNLCRPGGEEGFRGFHALAFYHTDGILLRGITVRNAGNYAVLCQHSCNLTFECLKILGGHDGIHIQKCRNVSVTGGDFRTGDDCLAGTDNEDVQVEDCYFNSACNAFRLGALRLTVRGCEFQGPGEFPHQVSVVNQAPRFSMGAAFIHFSPTDRNPEIPSDDWLVEDCTVDSCEALYLYNHQEGVWQTGQPAERILFRNIRATRLGKGIHILGDAGRSLHLRLQDVSMALAEETAAQPVIDIERFGSLFLEEVTLQNNGREPLLSARRGNRVALQPGPGVSVEDTVLEDIQDVSRDA
ncbi:MAG: right-handed parallel beta-helix repeat-containing protein [Verrucomicrobia bacterium]|nr:right-handed parallel beta-helix repeat-containing protein [Verrucomicrobiota bacterium]MCH8527537.1 right-handed parallel beta-helix repeat-containing protein [Kiritimatiellia bacterium]